MKTRLGYGVISVIEPPVENLARILSHKRADIDRDNVAYWAYRSDTNTTDQIQQIGDTKSGRIPCYFLSVGKGYNPQQRGNTQWNELATHYSVEGETWHQMPSQVTSSSANTTCALVLGEVGLRSEEWFDLWEYGNLRHPEYPVRFSQTGSTVGVVLSDTSAHPKRMKTNPRQLLAVGYLVKPYAVWLKVDNSSPESIDHVEDGVLPTILGNLEW